MYGAAYDHNHWSANSQMASLAFAYNVFPTVDDFEEWERQRPRGRIAQWIVSAGRR
jgi:hypothetical protein